ncbi:Ca-activated chloride channel family protein [Jatrophihabitans sp. GAS493]|nr:VWA domain-containing protein [Jatrophihabitans sp. GAS493]SOD73972.1 Ca-activated chloride channel family protein [Jatrophihabitans sp. GAS493]
MFLSPAWLLLLLLVAAAAVTYVAIQLRRKKYAARFSNVSLLASVAPKRPGWRRHLTFGLLLLGMAILTIGLAQPTASVRVPRDRATVMLAIDVSQSMQATDVLPNRIEAAKAAAKTFVDLLPSRINVGLVKFAGNASVAVSPTTDRDSLKVAIDSFQLENSTAIGEAIYTCLDAISVFSKSSTAKNDKPAPARIVLMSDGSNTKGRDPLDAAQAAKSVGVAVSTIAFGTDSGTVTVQGETIPVPADKATLKAVADDTGGTFHTAASAEELRQVYQNIGSQIGYTTSHKVVSWRFMLLGLLLLFGASAASLLWGGRLA